jgi:hypothetical protein
MKLLLTFNMKTCSNHPSSYSAWLSKMKVSQHYINSNHNNDGCNKSNFIPKLMATFKPFSLSCYLINSWEKHGNDEISKYVLLSQATLADILVIHRNSRHKMKRNDMCKDVKIIPMMLVYYASCRLVFSRSAV